MAASDVKKTYKEVIEDVCRAVSEALLEEGYDNHTLGDLRNRWLERLENSKALEPLPTSIVDQATTRDHRHAGPGDTGNSSKHPAGLKQNNNRSQPAFNAGVPTFTATNYTPTTSFNPGLLSSANAGTTQLMRSTFPVRPSNPTNIASVTMKTANQLDGANDEQTPESSTTKKNKRRKKKSPIVEISFQLDGTGPPVGEDEDEDEDSEVEGNDVADDIDDDDDDEDGREEGKEDPNPLCSDDDVSDDETAELFETDNVVVCQYDKISRTKNKWRFILKSGVMNIEGRDYVFSKATGDADW